MNISRKIAAGVGAACIVVAGLGTAGAASAADGRNDPINSAFNSRQGTDKPAPPAAPGTRPGTVTIVGTPVENIRPDAAAPETSDWCSRAGAAPRGEGLANKGGTCLSTPIGEVSVNPVRVTANAQQAIRVGQTLNVRIKVADDQGILDLNAFTKDATGGAGTTFLERPGELQANGRPLLHGHIGIAKVAFPGAMPPADNDAAFSGVQGVRGDLTARVTGLPAGFYHGSVWFSQPGHPILPTAVASRTQAIDTFDFVVLPNRGGRR